MKTVVRCCRDAAVTPGTLLALYWDYSQQSASKGNWEPSWRDPEQQEPHRCPLPTAKAGARRMEAPLVSLEEEFEEGPGDDGGTPRRTADPALAELESFSAEMMSFKSMEDLVQEFDEKLTVCFRNYDAATEGLAPVRGRLQAQEEEERLQDEE